jgi:hypothetical protein
VNGWIDPVNRIGDFGPVGALAAYRRQGLTRAALLEGLRLMKARGMNRVCISTGGSNTPAMRLYQSVGFKIMNRRLGYVWSAYEGQCPGRPSLLAPIVPAIPTPSHGFAVQHELCYNAEQ